ncbi:hypothetical protein ABZX93_16345 [Streptomyces sp. NPDC006632]|uniref:hypothetical protein n=1 Tax=unclassified Streptomyces TaxID=2593676 RepID=UPI002E1F4C2D
MTSEEPRRIPTEAEARAAFVAVVGGAAADPERVRALAAADPALAGTTADMDSLLDALAARAAAGRGPGARWGMDLVTGELRRVHAPDVPATGGTAAGPPVGAAAGFTWLSAVEEGLAQQCESVIAERLTAPGLRIPRLDLRPACSGSCHPADCESCAVAPLRASGTLVVHDVSELLSLPACALRLAPGRETVIATAAVRSAAVHRAVDRALRGRLRAVPAVRPDQECPPSASRTAPVQWSRPFDALRAGGWSPAAVLLDHDPGAVAGRPYLVQVVLPDPLPARPAHASSAPRAIA